MAWKRGNTSKVNIQQQGIQEGDMEDIRKDKKNGTAIMPYPLFFKKINYEGKPLKIKCIPKNSKFRVFYNSIKSPDL